VYRNIIVSWAPKFTVIDVEEYLNVQIRDLYNT